ncbi:MAG: hypothetical protein NVS2B16_37410 [Chloroflexota bacterium]
MNRIVKHTTLEGVFAFPIGVTFLNRTSAKSVEISTVCLEGGHLEDPLGILEPEHGYETMVFPDGSRLLAVASRKYDTREKADEGHDEIVGQILEGKLPLAVPIQYFCAATGGLKCD